MRDGWTAVILKRHRKALIARKKARLAERIELAKSLGWTDLREVRVFGSCGIVLKGNRPFWNAGVQVFVRDDVPLDDEAIISLTNQNSPSNISP